MGVRRREVRKRENSMVFNMRVALCWCIWPFLFDVDFVGMRVWSWLVYVQVMKLFSNTRRSREGELFK